MPIKNFIIALLLLATSLSVSAGPPKAMAHVNMKSGMVYESVEVEIPANDLVYLKAKIDGKMQKLNSSDVESLILWNKKNPADKYVMIYHPRKVINYKKGTEKVYDTPSWLTITEIGENMSLLVYAGGISVDKGSISMSPGYHTKDEFFALWKHGEPNPVVVKFGGLRSGNLKEWLMNFLADDPVIVKKISEGGYYSKKQSLRNGSYWCPWLLEEIVKDYSPQKSEDGQE